MLIGNVKIDNNIMLAPMAGITDMPFRLICRQMGCGFVYSEMVSAKGMYYKDKKTRLLTDLHEDELPAAVQIFGSEPCIMAEAAKKLNGSKASFIDINMGCPTPKITRNGDGCALMQKPELAAKIVAMTVEASEKPVTVKIRKGWDDEHVNAVEIALAAQENGAAAVAVHGRTRQQFYKGEADWDIIKKVKKALKIPVIGNGDIFTPQDAKRMLEETNCDAVMIARGARGNPWIFSRTAAFVKHGRILPQPAAEDKIDIVKKHMQMVIDLKGEYTALREMRKHIAWYIKGMYNAARVKQQVFKLDDCNSVLKALDGLR